MRMSYRGRALLALGLLVLGLPALPALAQEPDAQAIVDSMVEGLQGLDAFELVYTGTYPVPEGEEAPEPIPTRFALERATNLRIECGAEGEHGLVISGPHGIYAFMPSANQYVIADVVTTSEELETAYAELGLGIALESDPTFLPSILLSADPSTMFPPDLAWTYVGAEEHAGAACHHVMSDAGEGTALDLWIQSDGAPLLRGLALSMVTMESEDEESTKEVVLDCTVLEWDTAPQFGEELWQFDAPEDAEQVESFLQGGGEGDQPLLNEPAPDFELKSLDGKTIQLSEVLGECEVVILDFWATWCGPCRAALPAYCALMEEYAGKPVAFYAVSQGDSADDIKACLQELKINPTVLLDSDMAVGSSYGASGIPHTVVIDKDGVIRSVHIGYSEGTEDVLRGEIDTLLAGGTIEPPATTGGG